MVDLEWCKKQERGIKFVEPNENLSEEYLKNAEETLSILKDLEGKLNMWLATSKYYFEYFCIYSLLMKIRINCEIHDCTIQITKFLADKKIIPENFYNLLKEDKELRIENQYYLKNKKVIINYDEMTDFLLKTKDILNKLTFEKINEIRSLL